VRIRLAIPDRLVTPEALEAALEATSLANEQAIIRGEVPPLTEAIRKGVRWKPEPYSDGEHFDLSHVVAARKWGDCDDLAPWLTGELRATGEDPGARSRVYKSGPDRWHVVTETSDGQILDPSKWAGMGRKSSPSVSGVCGVTARPFARPGEGALCCVPHQGRYWSRVDLPFPNAAGHLASHARARTPEESLERAIAGAIACGEEIDSELCDRARLMGAMLIGELDGDMELGSFFGKLLKKALPFATSFIPGVGPIASKVVKSAVNIVDKAGRKKGAPAPAQQVRASSASSEPTPQAARTTRAAPTTVVRQLSHGGGQPRPTPDTITHAPTGAVSVPIATPAAAAPTSNPAMLYYHPANSIGPVVMRF
jgi:hypothetical protein